MRVVAEVGYIPESLVDCLLEITLPVAGHQLCSFRWQLAGVNTVTPGEMVTLTRSPSAAFQESSFTNWFNASCVMLPIDPSQPFGNATRNNVRGSNFWQFDLAALKQIRRSAEAAAGVFDSTQRHTDVTPAEPV